MPNCPLALWDYAGALEMLDQTEEALSMYRRLVRRGVSAIAHGTCGEGLAWGRGLMCRLPLPDGALLQGEAATGHGKEVTTEPSLASRAWMPVHLPLGYRSARASRIAGTRSQ